MRSTRPNLFQFLLFLFKSFISIFDASRLHTYLIQNCIINPICSRSQTFFYLRVVNVERNFFLFSCLKSALFFFLPKRKKKEETFFLCERGRRHVGGRSRTHKQARTKLTRTSTRDGCRGESRTMTARCLSAPSSQFKQIETTQL